MCLKESFKHYQALVKYKHKCTHLTATFWKIKRWNLTLAPFPLKRASASVVPEHSAIDVPFYGIQLAGIYPDCSTKFLVPSHCLILVLVGQGFIYKASADSLQLSKPITGPNHNTDWASPENFQKWHEQKIHATFWKGLKILGSHSAKNWDGRRGCREQHQEHVSPTWHIYKKCWPRNKSPLIHAAYWMTVGQSFSHRVTYLTGLWG